MIRTAKKLAACVLMLGVLLYGTALSAAAASLPLEQQNGVSLPWAQGRARREHFHRQLLCQYAAGRFSAAVPRGQPQLQHRLCGLSDR